MRNFTPLLLAGLASAFPQPDDVSSSLKPRVYTSDYENQLTDGTPCRKVSVIWARGANAPGNVGGPGNPGGEMFWNLRQIFGIDNVACQGVNYNSDMKMVAIDVPKGGSQLAEYLHNTAVRCPNTKILISGYSLGAEVVYNAMSKISDADVSRINAVVQWGAPGVNAPANGPAGLGVGKPRYGNPPRAPFPRVTPSRVLMYCHAGDDICNGGVNSRGEHHGYESAADQKNVMNFAVPLLS